MRIRLDRRQLLHSSDNSQWRTAFGLDQVHQYKDKKEKDRVRDNDKDNDKKET